VREKESAREKERAREKREREKRIPLVRLKQWPQDWPTPEYDPVADLSLYWFGPPNANLERDLLIISKSPKIIIFLSLA
jgi:hypothetical protein